MSNKKNIIVDIVIPEPVKHLDHVLEVLYSSKKLLNGWINIQVLKDELNFKNDEELDLILDKLVQDGNIKKEPDSKIYSITLNGAIFFHSGSYSGESFRAYQASQTSIHLIGLQRSQKTLTFWIALATGIAGVYYLVMLIDYFF